MNAQFIAETPQGTEPILSAVPLIQPTFQRRVPGMLYPIAVAFMPEDEISGYDFSDWFTSRLRDFVN